MKKILLTTFIVCAVIGVKAIKPENLLAKPYNNPELLKFISSLGKTESTINAAKSSYIITAFSSGVQLEFNFNMILSNIWLFKEGSRYKSYTDTLPFSLKWGLDEETLSGKKYLFNPDSDNQFKYNRELANGMATAYLEDNKLASLYLEANKDLIEKADEENFKFWGVRVYPDGNVTEGDCENGKGTMQFDEKGSRYEGMWQYGVPNGKGIFYSPDGTVWEGSFVQGFPWGEVKVISPNNYTYNGQMLFGKRNGKGRMVYATGEMYDGDWVDNTMQGQGTYTIGTGFRYVGSFKNGKFNGFGTLDTPEGIFEGSFKDGKPHGKGTQKVFRTQAILKGTWVDGKKEGSFIYNDPFSGSKTIKYKNDLETGQ